MNSVSMNCSENERDKPFFELLNGFPKYDRPTITISSRTSTGTSPMYCACAGKSFQRLHGEQKNRDVECSQEVSE